VRRLEAKGLGGRSRGGDPHARVPTQRTDVPDSKLSEAASRFLIEQIGSIERLDVLLIVHRQAQRWWASQALGVELGMPVEAVQGHLEQLSAFNVLAVRIADSVLYRYQPGTAQVAQVVDEVVRAHYADRDAVSSLVARRGPAESIRLFAEAFRFRKGKRHG
jgi:hypothetical protein